MPYSDPYGKLQEILTEARQEKGLTQASVAKELGKPQSFVSKYESGERGLDVIEFLNVCEVLSVSPQALLTRLQSQND